MTSFDPRLNNCEGVSRQLTTDDERSGAHASSTFDSVCPLSRYLMLGESAHTAVDPSLRPRAGRRIEIVDVGRWLSSAAQPSWLLPAQARVFALSRFGTYTSCQQIRPLCRVAEIEWKKCPFPPIAAVNPGIRGQGFRRFLPSRIWGCARILISSRGRAPATRPPSGSTASEIRSWYETARSPPAPRGASAPASAARQLRAAAVICGAWLRPP
jgi:hypothetical protein